MPQLVTLALCVRDDEILLAMKKRGFGEGLWNGAGGKPDKGETIEQAMIRECQEEIGITPTQYEKVAIHTFDMDDTQPFYTDIEAHVYLVTEWQGQPTESEEMAPKWFKKTEIPYDDMWQDDVLWLPLVLRGKKLETTFVFDANDNLTKATLTVVDRLR